MGKELVDRVLAGDPAASISEATRATLVFLSKMTLEPDALGPNDVAAVRAAGVSRAALEDAIDVAFAFNLIDRVADTLEFRVGSAEEFDSGARTLLQRGYKM